MGADEMRMSLVRTIHQPPAGFAGVEVVIIPFPALGDITIYLRLGWLFYRAGARVTFYSDALFPAREYFAWLTILPEGNESLEVLAERFELVIACFEKCYHLSTWLPEYAQLQNIAFVTAKKISRESGLAGRDVVVGERVFTGASRAFCLDSRSGRTMVDWVDSYAKEVFGVELDTTDGFVTRPSARSRADLVLIFPTTPQAKKNYWLSGFRFLAQRLQRQGWCVEFVCMPSEREAIASALQGQQVRSFPDIKTLIDHVAGAAVVISNDSGGGHLASMLGLATYTITRRREKFVWRPGFNSDNTVVYPYFRFKWLDKKYVWRPFVPLWRVLFHMNKRG